MGLKIKDDFEKLFYYEELVYFEGLFTDDFEGTKRGKLHEDCWPPDPHADAEVSEADEQHDDVDDEEEVLRALQPPVRALQLPPAHRAVTHPAATHSLGSLTAVKKNLSL